jgi:hypothetical protein
MKHQNGFALIEGILIVVVLAIVGFVGYQAYSHLIAQNSPKATSVASGTPSPSAAPVTIQKKADLANAATALDSVSLDDSDSSQLDSISNSF